MYSISIENAKGNRIQLSQNKDYSITSITGLNPPSANINTGVNASFDGATFKSSRLNVRNLVIMLAIEGNVEQNRINLYRFIKVKQACTVYFKNNTREVYIGGYVESMEIGIFEQKQIVQISIICPKPYFTDVLDEEAVFSSVIPLFEFPFSIPEEGIEFGELNVNSAIDVINNGDIATGMVIEFYATDEVTDPAIYNLETNEYMKLNVTLQAGDRIQINTEKGNKSVTKISGGVRTNILNALDAGSSWLILESGDNIMTYTATVHPEYLSCTVYHNDLYEGV